MNILYPALACKLCPGRRKPLMGDGPQPCRFLFIGEGPAREEDRRGRVFAGRTGQEFDGQYLTMAGLVRDEVRVTNATKCSCPGYKNPSVELAQSCADRFLEKELLVCKPEVVVTMGAVANSIFPGVDLNLHHGLPMDASYKDWSGTIFPMYHPSAGMHSPEFMVPIQDDFRRLGEWKRGRLETPVDGIRPFYRHMRDAGELERMLGHVRTWDAVALDTESVSLHGDPWCVTLSVCPGTAWLIKADNHECLRTLSKWVSGARPLIVMHNAAYDLGVLARMGVTVPRWTDTMMIAYHLMRLPQGLKALAYRLLGMHMRDFEDLVRPYANGAALAYLELANDILVAQGVPKRKRGTPVPHMASVATKVKRALGDYAKSPDAIDLMDRMRQWEPEDHRLLVETTLLPVPRPSITMVPWIEALHYACRDADATLRLFAKLRPMTTNILSVRTGKTR